MNKENTKIMRMGPIGEMERIERITGEKVVNALKKMRPERAVGPDNIPAKVWKCLKKFGVSSSETGSTILLLEEKYRTSGGTVCWSQFTRIK